MRTCIGVFVGIKIQLCHLDVKVKVKGKRSIAVRKKPHRYGNSRAIWDHTVLPATQYYLPLPQPKLVLD